MTASETYLLEMERAIERARPPESKKQERRRERAKPVSLPGGCLLYRFPARLRVS